MCVCVSGCVCLALIIAWLSFLIYHPLAKASTFCFCAFSLIYSLLSWLTITTTTVELSKSDKQKLSRNLTTDFESKWKEFIRINITSWLPACWTRVFIQHVGWCSWLKWSVCVLSFNLSPRKKCVTCFTLPPSRTFCPESTLKVYERFRSGKLKGRWVKKGVRLLVFNHVVTDLLFLYRM